LLEADIRHGRHLSSLPDDLVPAMLATLPQPVDLAAEIEGDVAL
jgi:antitoxin PrlF